MTRRKPRWEIVTTPAGIHVRYRASNGRIVASSEVYDRRRDALRVIELVNGFEPREYEGALEVAVNFGIDPDGLLEVREVDGR